MRSSSERRMSIIEKLSERRSDSIDNLAFEFGVSRRTMRNDCDIFLWTLKPVNVKINI